MAEAGFHAMLQHWVRRPSPLPSWSALIRALKYPVINRADIAAEIEEHQVYLCYNIVHMCVHYVQSINRDGELPIPFLAHQSLFFREGEHL